MQPDWNPKEMQILSLLLRVWLCNPSDAVTFSTAVSKDSDKSILRKNESVLAHSSGHHGESQSRCINQKGAANTRCSELPFSLLCSPGSSTQRVVLPTIKVGLSSGELNSPRHAYRDKMPTSWQGCRKLQWKVPLSCLRHHRKQMGV